ncbi:PH domain-containing protein [Mycena indigotica]|uniref:PH domain-containing protein n=1 Tax=Mycena indigotica TaxID=2126181 RepID=A0A8H6S508_9AGAR|nr:PH domain-containing protein [Mycena indigotica]KAF7292941.1 PH domain-containing protein [Mycena indigotica]
MSVKNIDEETGSDPAADLTDPEVFHLSLMTLKFLGRRVGKDADQALAVQPISPRPGQGPASVYHPTGAGSQYDGFDPSTPVPIPVPGRGPASQLRQQSPSVFRLPSTRSQGQAPEYHDAEGNLLPTAYDAAGNVVVPSGGVVYDSEGRRLGPVGVPSTPYDAPVSIPPSQVGSVAAPIVPVPASGSARSGGIAPAPPTRQPTIRDTAEEPAGQAFDTSGPYDPSFEAIQPIQPIPGPGRAAPRARSPSPDRYFRPPAATPIDLGHAEAERERDQRLQEVEARLQEALASAEEAEDGREREFRDSEEARNKIFFENEARREQQLRDREEERVRWGAKDLGAPADVGGPPGATPTATPRPGSMAGAPRSRPQTAFSYRPGPMDDTAATGGDGASMHTMEQAASAEAASIMAGTIRDTVEGERELLQREMAEMREERARLEAERDAARQAVMEEKEARVRALEQELATLKGELENERQLRNTDTAEAQERERAAYANNEEISAQLGDITNLVQDQRGICEEQKSMMLERWKVDDEHRQQKEDKWIELKDMVHRLYDGMEEDRARTEEWRAAEAAKPNLEKIIEELKQQNAEQRELLTALSENWRADSIAQHEATLEAVRSTAREQVDFNVQGYLDEFSKALASEVRMLLGEVGKLREERRALQHELGYLLTMKSKYGPGGEFEPDWKPPAAGDAGPQPPQPPPPPPDLPQARPGWRTVTQRGPPPPRKPKKKDGAPAPQPPPAAAGGGPPPTTHGMDPRSQVRSWATWQPDPGMAPTPPSREPTLLAPEQPPQGLFGPRTPRSSVYAP